MQGLKSQMVIVKGKGSTHNNKESDKGKGKDIRISGEDK